MQPYPFHFPLSAIAGKPIGSPKMTTNDDIFAADLGRNTVISTGCGILGVEK